MQYVSILWCSNAVWWVKNVSFNCSWTVIHPSIFLLLVSCSRIHILKILSRLICSYMACCVFQLLLKSWMWRSSNYNRAIRHHRWAQSRLNQNVLKLLIMECLHFCIDKEKRLSFLSYTSHIRSDEFGFWRERCDLVNCKLNKLLSWEDKSYLFSQCCVQYDCK